MLITEAVECSKGEGFFLEKPGGHLDVGLETFQIPLAFLVICTYNKI